MNNSLRDLRNSKITKGYIRSCNSILIDLNKQMPRKDLFKISLYTMHYDPIYNQIYPNPKIS